jgi:hypothetical protein
MAGVADDGWELVTAPMSTYIEDAAPNAPFPITVTRYRCTMFWRKPTVTDPDGASEQNQSAGQS